MDRSSGRRKVTFENKTSAQVKFVMRSGPNLRASFSLASGEIRDEQIQGGTSRSHEEWVLVGPDGKLTEYLSTDDLDDLVKVVVTESFELEKFRTSKTVAAGSNSRWPQWISALQSLLPQ